MRSVLVPVPVSKNFMRSVLVPVLLIYKIGTRFGSDFLMRGSVPLLVFFFSNSSQFPVLG